MNEIKEIILSLFPLGIKSEDPELVKECEKKARAIQALFDKRVEGIINAYEDMLDGMGLGRENFKASDWDYVQALKSKIKEGG